MEPTPQTVEALMKLDLASGVDIEIKLKEALFLKNLFLVSKRESKVLLTVEY